MPKNKSDEYPRLEAKNRIEWHEWLKENHLTSKGIWLVYYKKNSLKDTVLYDEAVEEALSFGWIDSKVNAIDEERYMQIFTPRKPGSIWSKLNKQRIQKLMEQGLMQPAGLNKVERAKKDGSWNFLDDVEKLIIPEDFKLALNSDREAKNNFEALGNSSKKQILYWIKSAKRDSTRENRIQKTVKSASKNKMPF